MDSVRPSAFDSLRNCAEHIRRDAPAFGVSCSCSITAGRVTADRADARPSRGYRRDRPDPDWRLRSGRHPRARRGALTKSRFGSGIALVRHPDFAKRARTVVIECGSSSEQSTLDRYIQGENVSQTQLERVWKTVAGGSNGFCDAPMYADFLAAVRDVNSKLPADARVRVLGGDPRSRETASLSVLREPVLQRHGKALLIYGAAHFYLTGPPDYLSSLGNELGIAGRLGLDYTGRWLAIIPIGGVVRPPGVKEADVDPDYQKFDRALKAPVRPVLVSLQRRPFRDFTAEEFLGRTVITCRGSGGCRSVFKGSTLKLGQMADVGVYVGPNADAAVQAKPVRFE